MMNTREKLFVLCVLAAIGCAMAFVVSLDHYVGMSAVPAASTDYLWSALAVVFAVLFWVAAVRMRLKLRPAHMAFGLFFGIANYFGTMLFAYDTWSFLQGPLAWGKAVFAWMGQGFVMAVALAVVDRWLAEGIIKQQGGFRFTCFPRLRRLYREHTLVFCVIVLCICWLPYLVVFYPGTFSWDIGEMTAQFFGHRDMDTWHPVFLTWVVGSFLWIGRTLGSDNLGIALLTLLQTAALAYALGYSLQWIRKAGAHRLVQAITLVFFALTPIWGSYAQFICKDTLYTAMLLLFAVQTLEWLTNQGEKSRLFLVRYAISALLTCLLRNNGLYVILPTAVLVVLLGAKSKERLRVGVALGSVVLCAMLFSSVLMPVLGIRDETASGLYSVCFQQSARVLRDHGSEVTAEEYAAIDEVLDAPNLPTLYEPWISDPVKYTFKQYGLGAAEEKKALARYSPTWLSMLSKYPVTYLEAFVGGNSAYYAFLPKMEGETFNNQAGNRFVFETHPQTVTNLKVNISHPSALDGLRSALAAFARGWRHIPLLSMLLCCAAYTWLLVGVGISVGRQRRFQGLIGFMPALMSLATCMLSPVNDYFRYFLPIVAMTPVLIVFASAQTEAPK